MQFSVVRIIESRKFVGLFAAEIEDDLALLVDECCAPYRCEYAPMPSGGMMAVWPEVPVIPFPFPPEEQMCLSDFLPKYSITGDVRDALCDKNLESNRLDPDCLLVGSMIDYVIENAGLERLNQLIKKGVFVDPEGPHISTLV
ncbi:hypothetical protein [Jannaschia formosa]|uniref:hypothetical protein n=1 Tax=Jannaschia formosa TaxID=2259592 RepID=UPI0010755C85|nr:hypothetical protein [Jannaschia formosa]TFL16569.1 hypothetical protein DR046_19420 [Jannaschia formosa]